MKKYTAVLFCAVCALAMTLLLSGCLPAFLMMQSVPDEALEKEMEEKWEDDWSAKSHYWQVLDAEGREVCLIKGEEAVQRVDDLVEDDMEWAEVSGVEDAAPLYTYVFMQQKTLLAGQDPETEREYEEVLRFTVYEGTDVMSMTVLKSLGDSLPSSVVDWEDILTIHAKPPAETAEALRDPAQFTQSEYAPRPPFRRARFSEVVPFPAADSKVLQQADNGLDSVEAVFVGERVVRQNVPDSQQRPAAGVRDQTAVEFLYILHNCTSHSLYIAHIVSYIAYFWQALSVHCFYDYWRVQGYGYKNCCRQPPGLSLRSAGLDHQQAGYGFRGIPIHREKYFVREEQKPRNCDHQNPMRRTGHVSGGVLLRPGVRASGAGDSVTSPAPDAANALACCREAPSPQ